MATTMKNWKTVFNKTTKIDNYTMIGKLIRISSDIRENGNETQYRLCEIEIPHPNNDTKLRSTAQIYENNFKYGMTEGENYLVTANPALDSSTGKTRLYFTMSHLQGNPSVVLMEDLGLEIPAAPFLEVAKK